MSVACSGMHETLVMTVSLPLLWGIPPAHEFLRCSHGFPARLSMLSTM